MLEKNLKPDVSSNWSLPATYFQTENYCLTRHSSRVFKCPEGNRYYVGDVSKCFKGCCENNTKDASGRKYPVPDGTSCGDKKICIATVCSEFSKQDSD
uniref:Putative metalloprotease n=1 Tax=Ixodes ricinus TaxID=34613 RepID=A0A0K8R555_IXORI